ncbi:MAG: ABC transporter permease [Phycisphaerae bacterium]
MSESVYQKIDVAPTASMANAAKPEIPDAGNGDDPSAAVASPPPAPYLVLRPGSAWHLVDLAEVWYFRDLLLSFAGRDLKLRYKQTFLGIIWVILQPLLAAGIFTFVFGFIAKIKNHGIPMMAFSFASLLAWNLFANTLNRISTCMVANANMISKVYFPRIILPLSITLSTLVDFSVGAVMLVPIMLFFHLLPTWGLLLLPVWVVLILVMAVGIGMIAAALAVSYRDIQYILPIFMQMLMYASPVAYSISHLTALRKTHPVLATIFSFNPLNGILSSFRWSVFGGHPLAIMPLLWSIACALIAGILGLLTFKRLESRFADVI